MVENKLTECFKFNYFISWIRARLCCGTGNECASGGPRCVYMNASADRVREHYWERNRARVSERQKERKKIEQKMLNEKKKKTRLYTAYRPTAEKVNEWTVYLVNSSSLLRCSALCRTCERQKFEHIGELLAQRWMCIRSVTTAAMNESIYKRLNEASEKKRGEQKRTNMQHGTCEMVPLTTIQFVQLFLAAAALRSARLLRRALIDHWLFSRRFQ